jgi:hypothetical protein
MWLALGLFGPNDPWQTLLDDRPVISGAHPQNLYLGSVGAQSQATSGTFCAYDPAFAAGFPKTPIFNGSRFAEIMLLLGGGAYNPAAYKVGLWVMCSLVPLWLLVGCWGAGLSRGASLLALALGILVSWGPSGRLTLEAGDGDILLASLAVLAHAALLIRFHTFPGVVSWIGLVLTASLVWFSNPLVYPLALPLLLFYYLCVGASHGSLTWHAALFVAEAGAILVNLPWLIDWVGYWWLRSPLPVGADMLPHRTLQTLWEAPLWGGALDRGLALVVLFSGLAGAALLHYGQRLAARLLTLGAAGLLTLAFLGISWEPLGQMGTAVMFLPALWFAALPAAHAWTWMFGRLFQHRRWGRLVLCALLGGLAAVVYTWREELRPLAERSLAPEPLQIGLGPEREAVVQKIKQHTGPEARILWEDRPLPRGAPRWSALLPILTGRAFLGGLDPDAFIEHSLISFIDGNLEGRSIASWSAAALKEYCSRYNIGWVIAWTPAAVKRLEKWDGAVSVAELDDGGQEQTHASFAFVSHAAPLKGRLFLVKHARRDFVLKGKAKLVHADWHHITLADAVPEKGVLVISFHYQAGMHVTPSRVQIEREPCGEDPIGFIRLRALDPVGRITLTWGNR